MKKLVIPQQEEIPYLKTLLFIASADETLTDEELAFFSDEGENVGLSSEEIETAINWIKLKKEPLESIVKGIQSEETKTVLITRLLELCYLDGDYSLPEKSGMADLCILLDFDLKKLRKLESNAEFSHRMKLCKCQYNIVQKVENNNVQFFRIFQTDPVRILSSLSVCMTVL